MQKGEFYWLLGDKILRVDGFDSESDGHKVHFYVAGKVLDTRWRTVEFDDAGYERTMLKLSRRQPVTANEKEELKKRFEKLGSLDIFEEFFAGK